MALCAVCSYFLDDLATIVTTTAGILMAAMAGVGYLTHGYLDLAERTGTWSFLRTGANADEEDILIVTKYDDEIIGALVLRLVPLSDKKNAKFYSGYSCMDGQTAISQQDTWHGLARGGTCFV